MSTARVEEAEVTTPAVHLGRAQSFDVVGIRCNRQRDAMHGMSDVRKEVVCNNTAQVVRYGRDEDVVVL